MVNLSQWVNTFLAYREERIYIYIYRERGFTYIYIYIERERERESIYLFGCTKYGLNGIENIKFL